MRTASMRGSSVSMRALCTNAARRRGDDLTAFRTMEAWKTRSDGDRAPRPPPGWDTNLVDRIITSTAAEIMQRPCIVKPKPDDMVYYVEDTSRTSHDRGG